MQMLTDRPSGRVERDGEVRVITERSAGIGIDGVEEDELEQFFLEREFEFIDAEDVRAAGGGEDGEEEEEGMHYDVVGLPRVLESLSTVMWPSMVRNPGGKKPFDLSLLDDGEPESELPDPAAEEEWEEEENPAAVEAHVKQTIDMLREMRVSTDTFEGRLALAEHQERARNEREALEGWLEGEVTGSVAPSAHGGGEEEFGEMVGAQPEKEERAELEDADEEAPGAGWAALEEDDDDGLPTETEIVQTHLQIFGPPLPPGTTTRPRGVDDPPRREDHEQDFDLSSALGALQSMRDEIRGMTDDRERHRAAARVALGLVHGLGLDEEDLDEVMRHG